MAMQSGYNSGQKREGDLNMSKRALVVEDDANIAEADDKVLSMAVSSCRS